MNVEMLIVFSKLLAILACVVAGILTARIGLKLFLNGAGLGPSKTVVEFGKVKFTSHSVGSLVMCSAVVWGYFATKFDPVYEKDGDGSIRFITRMTQGGHVLEVPEIEFPKIHGFETPTSGSEVEAWRAYLRDSKIFDKAEESINKSLKVDGREAKVDWSRLQIERGADGKTRVKAPIENGIDGVSSPPLSLEFEMRDTPDGRLRIEPVRVTEGVFDARPGVMDT